jgi:hypothetical protein
MPAPLCRGESQIGSPGAGHQMANRSYFPQPQRSCPLSCPASRGSQQGKDGRRARLERGNVGMGAMEIAATKSRRENPRSPQSQEERKP